MNIDHLIPNLEEEESNGRRTNALASREEVAIVEYFLLKHCGQIYADVFTVGRCLGLRVNDLLSIKFSDILLNESRLVMYESKQLKAFETKCKKAAKKAIEQGATEEEARAIVDAIPRPRKRNLRLNQTVMTVIKRRIREKQKGLGHRYLFTSESNRANTDKPLARQSVGRKLQEASEHLNEIRKSEGKSELRISTHSMRKTFARGLFEKGLPASTVSEIIGHSNVRTTRRYIDIQEQANDKAYMLLDDLEETEKPLFVVNSLGGKT